MEVQVFDLRTLAGRAPQVAQPLAAELLARLVAENVSVERKLDAIRPELAPVEDFPQRRHDRDLPFLPVLRLRGQYDEVVLRDLGPLQRAKLARTATGLDYRVKKSAM